MRRTLVAGFGNVLRGDDGFGVEVIREMNGQAPRRPEPSCSKAARGGSPSRRRCSRRMIGSS